MSKAAKLPCRRPQASAHGSALPDIDAAEIAELLPYLTPAERAQVDAIIAVERSAVAPAQGPADDGLREQGRYRRLRRRGRRRQDRPRLRLDPHQPPEGDGAAPRRHRADRHPRPLHRLIGNRDGYNGQQNIWRTKRYDGKPLQIEFGAVPNLGDEKKYQGRPHDKLVFDEAANFLESQVRFLLGWLRSSTPTSSARPCCASTRRPVPRGAGSSSSSRPGSTRSTRSTRSCRAKLRYAAMLPADNGTSRDVWVDGPEPFVLVGEPCYDFDLRRLPARGDHHAASRTFIPARVTDNPHLYGTGYMAQLQALPEPLRSQMLNGDFHAGMEDDPWQVIPTEWIEPRWNRWREPLVKPEMDSMGVDVARGGKDQTTIARRHGNWFDKTLVYPGTATPDGPSVRRPGHLGDARFGPDPHRRDRRRRQPLRLPAHRQAAGHRASTSARSRSATTSRAG
jgi:hypothetical protein